VPVTIAVAEGPAKVAPILGALRGRLLKTLVTDVATAEAVVALDDAAA
jgi:DNA-binding transcriptional regulator LsrR (DeoR family)